MLCLRKSSLVTQNIQGEVEWDLSGKYPQKTEIETGIFPFFLLLHSYICFLEKLVMINKLTNFLQPKKVNGSDI